MKPSNNSKLITLVKIETLLDVRECPPYGLLYIGDALKRAGFHVRVYHLSTQDYQQYVKIISDDRPLFVGFSVLTGWGIEAAANLSRAIKRSSGILYDQGAKNYTFIPGKIIW